jgi:hypothetical protein
MMAEIERQLEAEAPDGRSHQERIVSKLIELAEEGGLIGVKAADLLLRRVAPEKLAVEQSGGGVTTLILRDYSGLDAEEKAAIEQVRERRKREGRDPGMPEAAPPGSVVVTTGLEAVAGVGERVREGRSKEGPRLLPAGPRSGPETHGPTLDVTPDPNGESEEPEPDRWRPV